MQLFFLLHLLSFWASLKSFFLLVLFQLWEQRLHLFFFLLYNQGPGFIEVRDDISIFYYAQCARALSLYHLRRLYHLAMYGYPKKN